MRVRQFSRELILALRRAHRRQIGRRFSGGNGPGEGNSRCWVQRTLDMGFQNGRRRVDIPAIR